MKKISGLILAVILTACNSTTTEETGTYIVPDEIKSLPEGTTLGLRAPEIELPNTEGVEMKLSDLQGKVVLIDFWASWCNPCRQENPVLVATYAKFKNTSFTKGNGFEILSVSLDRNETAWKEAIKKDELSWSYQLSDLTGAASPAAQTYGVQMIPTNFLLDQNGVIIASNLRGEALAEKLETLLPAE